MRSRFLVRLAAIATLAAVTGGLKCAEGPLDVGTGPLSTSVAGTWQGPIQDLTMRLVLAQSGTTVTGTGTMTQAGTPFTLTVSGTNTNGTFSLEISEVEHAPFTFTGTVQLVSAVRTMVGVANGAGFTNQSISLTRQ
jgi:hypothetical protein